LTDKLQNALHYANLGWKLFPAVYREKQHRGLVKWGQKSSSNPQVITTWAKKWPNCYFCVNLRASGLTVLDIDDRDGKEGSVVLRDLLYKNSRSPLTPFYFEATTVRTPNNGFHYYFKQISAVTTGKVGKGIDTPVMVPIPNSEVKGKGKYILIKKGAFSALPPWLAELIGKPREKSNPDEDIKIPVDTDFNIERALNYLKNEAPLAIEHEGGDITTYNVACRLHDLGLSQDTAFIMMSNHWNDRCQPPWSSGDLQTKVANAYRYAQNPLGTDTVEYEDLTAPPEETEPEVLSLTDMEMEPPPRKWVIENWIPYGEVGGFYGDGGLGKSRLAILLGLHIATGYSLFNIDVLTPMPVLYVPCEDDQVEVHRRVYEIKGHEDYELNVSSNAPFYVMSRASKTSILIRQNKRTSKLIYGPFYSILKKTIQILFNGRPAFLIADTLTDIFAVDMNDPMIASQCVKHFLSCFAKELNLTILVISHPSKTSLLSGTLDSGSPAWRNSFRYMLAMTEHENKNLKNHRYLKMMKSNYSVKQEPILLKYDGSVLVKEDAENIIDEVKERNLKTLLNIIERYQNTMPVGLHLQSKNSIKDLNIQDAAGGQISYKERKKLIKELMREGLVIEVKGKRRKNGLYIVGSEEEKKEGLE
jgi:RecA-family ATPase